MNDQQFQLTVRKGPQPGKIIELTSVSMTIGRDPMSEIPIDDPEVSRRHAHLIGTISGYRIQDLGSTNGTFVDGTRLGGEPVELQSGQTISIGGGVALLFQALNDDAGQAATMLELGAAFQEPQQPIEPSQLEDSARENAAERLDDDIVESSLPMSPEESLPDDTPDFAIDEESQPEPINEPFPPAAVWDQPQPEQSSPPDIVDAETYESDQFSEPVVIPHEGEKTEPPPAEQGSNFRRQSTIVAAAALLLICCCCSVILLFYYYLGDLLLREMGLLP